MEDYIKEPKDRLLRFGPDTVEYIRKNYKLDNKDDREKAIAIIDEWIKSQEHFMKKDFSKAYIERCIISCNGSLERTKQQIESICTMRTFLPHLFQVTSLNDRCMTELFKKGYACTIPKLTKEYHRIIIIKARPNIELESSDLSLLFKCLIYTAEYFKTYDYCLGYIVVFDIFDIKLSSLLPNVNVLELQQIIPVFTQGYGCRIKGIYLVTSSKLLETLIKILKPIVSPKIAKRIHAVKDRKILKDLIGADILPADYEGKEKPTEQLYADVLETFSTVATQDVVNTMKKAVVDKSKRQIEKFNADNIGVSGTFRTLSID